MITIAEETFEQCTLQFALTVITVTKQKVGDDRWDVGSRGYGMCKRAPHWEAQNNCKKRTIRGATGNGTC